MREIVADVLPTYPIDYDVDAALAKIESGDHYRIGWWRLIVKPGLEALDEIKMPTTRQSQWRYIGD